MNTCYKSRFPEGENQSLNGNKPKRIVLTCSFFPLKAIGIVALILLITGCQAQRHNIDTITRSDNPHLRFESDPLEQFIEYRGYVVSYDSAHKVPRFTIHLLTPKQITDSAGTWAKRSDRFWIDPRLGDLSATSADYYKSGYDRGHHVPAGDFVYSQRLKDESFALTNVSPQVPELNRGVFAALEQRIRDRVRDCNCEAYIITGTIFLRPGNETIGEGQVGIPSHIFKLVYYPSRRRMYAYRFPNYLGTYSDDIRDYQYTVDELEQLCEEDFFDRLPDDIETKLEKAKRRQ